MDLPWVLHDHAVAQIGHEQPLSLYLAQADNPRRACYQAFIQQRFAAHHGARVRHFMPCLLGLEDASGQLLGVVGLRSAGHAPLFLERYLSQSIETLIASRHPRHAPSRGQIIEVGNLAAGTPGTARLLIVALTDLLVAMGFRWVAFTGTPGLLNSFQRLGLTPLPLAPATPASMGDELADWGRYYEQQPQVMAGDIYAGHQRLLHVGAYPRLGHRPLYSQEGLPDVACR